MSEKGVSHIVPKHEFERHVASNTEPCLCSPLVVELTYGDVPGSPLLTGLVYYHNAFDGSDLGWDAELH